METVEFEKKCGKKRENNLTNEKSMLYYSLKPQGSTKPVKNKKGNPHMVHSMFLSPNHQVNLKNLPGGRTGHIEFAGEKTKGI